MNTCYLRKTVMEGSTLLWNLYIKIAIWNKAISKTLINPGGLNNGLEQLSSLENVMMRTALFCRINKGFRVVS